MITSNRMYSEAYVWIWLPGATEPVVAGKLETNGKQLRFNYGRRYLERDDAISIYPPELPLQTGYIAPIKNLELANCIRDAAPDAWGRRVIMNRAFGRKSQMLDSQQLDELTYLLESGSDRIGALDFQRSPTVYEPRVKAVVSLDELLESALRVEKGIPLTPELDQAICHGSSIGGARPKALITTDERKFVAKFSSSSDIYSVVKAEFIAMQLAKLVGLDVAPVCLVQSLHKDVLLIERFDRIQTANGLWQRKMMVSALTMLELHEHEARYASYETLSHIIRQSFSHANATLEELFSRIVFNIFVGNTDDHARNHAAFWDGKHLQLTPAYDICPQSRSGGIASQAMLIDGHRRESQLSLCVKAAAAFHLSTDDSLTIIQHQQDVIEKNWDAVCDEAQLTTVDKNMLWGRQFFNPYIFEGTRSML